MNSFFFFSRVISYSALKVKGQPMYKIARQGGTVEIAPRPVHIYNLVLANYSHPDVYLEVECGAGTYMRSLVHDIGYHLGCYAHMISLVRTKQGPFSLQDCLDVNNCTPESVMKMMRSM